MIRLIEKPFKSRTYRVGGLTPSARDAPHYVALFDELRRLGFVENQNITVETSH